MRYLIAIIVIASVTASSALSQGRMGDPDPYQDQYRAIDERLKSQPISFDFQDSPLTDVILFLRQVLNVNILLDPEVAREKDPEEMKVTLSVKDLRADSALNLLMSFKGLTRSYRNGVLVITTKDRHKEAVYLVIYDVRDLMFTVRDFPGPKIGLTTASATGAGVMFDTSTSDEEKNELSSPDRLLEIVKGNAGGSSWDDNSECAASVLNGMLVVSQTRSGHYEVSRLVNMLRGFR